MMPSKHHVTSSTEAETVPQESVSTTSSDQIKKMSPRLRRCLLILCLIIAAAIRGFLFVEYRTSPDYEHPLHDAEFRDYWARAIVTGDWTPPPGRNDPFADWLPHPHAPGYSWFLSGVYRIFGLGYDAPRLVQMFLGLLSILLLYDIARRLHNESAALIAAAMMALYFIFPLYEMDLGPISAIIFLLLYLIRSGARSLKRPRFLRDMTSGFLAGAVSIMRREFMPFGILFLGMHLYGYWKKGKWKEAAVAATVWSICFILPSVPGSIYNYKNTGELPLLGSEGTCLFYCSNNQWATGYNPDSPDLRAFIHDDDWSLFAFPAMLEGYAKAHNIKKHSYHDLIDHLKTMNQNFLTHETGRILKLMLKKQALFWGPVEIDENKVVACEKEHYAVIRYLPGFTPVLAVSVIGSALIFIRGIRRQKGFSRGKWILWGILLLSILAYSGIFSLFYVTARYRIPVIPILILFASAAVADWIDCLRCGHFKKALVGLGTFLLLMVLLSRPLVAFTPDTERWLDERRRAWVKINKADEGIADLERWNSRHPQSAGGHYHLALLLIEKGQPEEALKDLQTATALDPEYHVAYYNQGMVLLTLNRPDEAVESFKIRLERAEKDERAWFGLSQAWQALGNIEAQQNALDQALALKAGYPEALVDRSILFLKEGKRIQATELLEQALKASPGYAMAEFNLGLLYAEEGRYSTALDFFGAALTHGPGRADFHYNTGLVLIQLQQYEEAVRHFQEALVLQPDYPEIYSNLGLSLARLQQPEEAKEAFDRAFELLPHSGDTLYNHGCALNSLGDHEGARKHFEAVLEEEPSHGKALFELALLDMADNNLESALQHLNRAQPILSGDPEISYNLALIRQRQHNINEAQRYFSDTLQLNPDHFGANRGLGTLLRGADDSFSALPFLEVALRAEEGQEDGDLYYEYGLALKALERYDEAEEALVRAAELVPESADIQSHGALNYIAQGRYDEAASHFEKAMKLDPENLLLPYRLGLAQLEGGNAAAAVESLAPLLDAMPYHATLRYDYGRALAALSRHEEAIEAYGWAWLLDNGYLNAINGLGFSLSLSGRPEEALEWLHLALQMDPDNEDGLFNRGHALHILGRLKEAEDSFRALLRRDPHHSRGLLNLGLILERQGHRDAAQDAFEAALVEEERLALAHHHLAGLLRQKGERDDAIHHYRLARDYDPDNQNTLINLGFTLVEMGRITEAETLFTEAHSLAPEDAEALIGLGDVRMARNALAEAEEAYVEALSLAPDNPVALKQYGFLFLQQGKSLEALENFEKALFALPDDAGLYCGLGDVAFARGDLEHAEAHYQKAVELYPDFALAWNNYGDLLARRGQTNDAIRAYEKARALEPDNISVLLNLGRLHAREKEVEQALEVLETALRLEPENLRVRALVGDMKLLGGDVEAAVREYNRILLERPDWLDIRDKMESARTQSASS